MGKEPIHKAGVVSAKIGIKTISGRGYCHTPGMNPYPCPGTGLSAAYLSERNWDHERLV